MILSDRDIKEYIKSGRLVVEGLKDENIQAAWVDLTLGKEFRVFKTTAKPYIDVKDPSDHTEKLTVDGDFIMHPGEFVLGQVNEKIKIPDDLAAYVDGRSSLGRLGLVVHVTSGFVDPGFSGRLVLEMTNVGKMPIAIHPDMRICKLVFFKLSSKAEKPYFMHKEAKYKEQNNVIGSKISDEFNRFS
ncbi:MAG: dCTP deaminase [Candidatus Aenigmatarchaeota archaeon]